MNKNHSKENLVPATDVNAAGASGAGAISEKDFSSQREQSEVIQPSSLSQNFDHPTYLQHSHQRYSSSNSHGNDDDGDDNNDDDYPISERKRPQTLKARILSRKRFWCTWCCCTFLALLLVLLPITYFILLPKLVQSIVNDSQMAMDQLNITEPTEMGMWVSLKGGVRHGGLFPATIDFPEAVIVSWVVGSKESQDGKGQEGGEVRVLGKMEGLESVEISGGQGEIVDGRTRFVISDKQAFSDFAKELVSSFFCIPGYWVDNERKGVQCFKLW